MHLYQDWIKQCCMYKRSNSTLARRGLDDQQWVPWLHLLKTICNKVFIVIHFIKYKHGLASFKERHIFHALSWVLIKRSIKQHFTEANKTISICYQLTPMKPQCNAFYWVHFTAKKWVLPPQSCQKLNIIIQK